MEGDDGPVPGPDQPLAGGDDSWLCGHGVAAATHGRAMTEGNGLPGVPDPSAQSDEYFRDIADHAPTILWVTEPTGYCTYLNQQWYEFTGQGKDEALGYGWTRVVHPDDQERTTAIFLDALERQVPFQLDYRLRGADGEYRDAIDTGTPRFGANGAFLGYVGCVLDITERKELEKRLLQAQKMEAVGRLAAGIAHDFNNLLTTISGHAHLIADRIAPQHEFGDDLREIKEAVQRAASLTRQLLAFSRQQVLFPKVMDLNTAVRAAESMFRRVIGADIELRVELADGLPPIHADAAQIDQLILNLVINALDAMPDGGVLTIATEAWIGERVPASMESNGAAAVLIVKDTGMGMNETTKRHLFEPFFTTKPDGTGLGLATVYGIVEQSGGEISVTSEIGKGASFTVVLPGTQNQFGDEPALQDYDAPAGAGKVLVVEDEVSVRQVVARMLQRQGFEVVQAGNVEEAEQRLGEHDDIRLLITDLVMPGATGFDLVEHAARHVNHPLVLFMSGYAGDEMVRRGILRGEHAFIQKPFTPAELARAVADVLAERRRSE